MKNLAQHLLTSYTHSLHPSLLLRSKCSPQSLHYSGVSLFQRAGTSENLAFRSVTPEGNIAFLGVELGKLTVLTMITVLEPKLILCWGGGWG